MAKDDKTPEKKLSPEVEQLQDLYEVMLEKGLDSLELKDDDQRVKLTRRFAVSSSGGFVLHHAPQASARRPRPCAGIASASRSCERIRGNARSSSATPLAGVFYRASSPTSASFVKEGDSLDAGQTLCIVEAMKVMNEIKAESRCRILKIVAENGRVLSAGQALFQFEPA